jgi:hypothetical protein
MTLLADTHVHLYDSYNLDTAFSSAFANLSRLRPDVPGPTCLALFLAERRDCHAFDRLREHCTTSGTSRHRIDTTADDRVLSISRDDGRSLLLVAGRQIATRERLEVLALLGEPGVPDGGDILDTIGRVSEGGAVPVLAWAPGKWTGHREAVVRSVLRASSPTRLLVGDSSMRPRGWPVPAPLREAERQGFVVVAGTDPLPFRGQESVIGRYGISVDAETRGGSPLPDLRASLTGATGPVVVAGQRDSLASVAVRLVRHRLGG